jgi:hypothetical protein
MYSKFSANVVGAEVPQSRFESLQGQRRKGSLPSSHPDRILNATQASRGIKQLELQASHLPQSNIEIKNE